MKKNFLTLITVIAVLSCTSALANTPKKTIRGKKGTTEKTLNCKTAATKAVMDIAWQNARDTLANAVSEAKKEYADEIKTWVKNGKKGDKPEYQKPEFFAPVFTGIEVNEDDKSGNTFDVTTGENEECMVSYSVKVRKVRDKCTAKATEGDMDCG